MIGFFVRGIFCEIMFCLGLIFNIELISAFFYCEVGAMECGLTSERRKAIILIDSLFCRPFCLWLFKNIKGINSIVCCMIEIFVSGIFCEIPFSLGLIFTGKLIDTFFYCGVGVLMSCIFCRLSVCSALFFKCEVINTFLPWVTDIITIDVQHLHYSYQFFWCCEGSVGGLTGSNSTKSLRMG